MAVPSSAVRERPRLAAYVLTLNEERHVAGAVNSLKQVTDAIVVVDSFSGDATEAQALRAGALVWKRHFESFSTQRNYAVERLVAEWDPEWVLTIDADERISSPLVAEIRKTILEAEDGPYADAFTIPLRVRFSGRMLRFGGFSRSRLLRLYRPEAGRYEKRSVNEHFTLARGASLGALRAPIVHEDVVCWERHIAKHNRYSTLEAQERAASRSGKGLSLLTVVRQPHLRRRFLRDRAWNRLPAKPLLRFVQIYFLAGGFIDGASGFRIAVFHAWHEMCIEEKFKEIRRREGPPTGIDDDRRPSNSDAP
ncbi:MAG TPA: glycosyltransferase family 2 protein [Acidimicrobiales bacterium]|nr:glycosyltransferase family 2 protein [Acidimicrobiales bacterium]